MPREVFRIENGRFALTTTDPGITDACTATVADFPTEFECQITDGALTASPNVTQETVPATWCAPEEQLPQVGLTSYSLDISYLQDPQIVAGLSRFLYEHDTDEAWFFMGLDGDDPPKAVGKVRLTSGAIGGPGRTTLTASTSLPCEGKPYVCFGDASGSVNIGGDTDPDDLSSQYPGAAAMADLATLKADATYGDAGTSAPYNGGTGTEPGFASGTYIVLADASQAHWTGSAWLAGAA